jgi:hypothetical protein
VLDTVPPGARPGSLHGDHGLRRRRPQQRGGGDGRGARGRGRPREGAAQVRRPLVHRDLDQRGAGADGDLGAAREARRMPRGVPRGGRRGDRDRPLPGRRQADAPLRRQGRGRARHGVPPRRHPAVRADGDVPRDRREAARSAREEELRRRPEEDPRERQRLLEGVDHPQYDHEVQGGSVVKPLTGATNDGPSDAGGRCGRCSRTTRGSRSATG